MLVLSQDKVQVLVLNNFLTIALYKGSRTKTCDVNFCTENETYKAGTYQTESRAKDVLKELCIANDTHQCETFYEMPKE